MNRISERILLGNAVGLTGLGAYTISKVKNKDLATLDEIKRLRNYNAEENKRIALSAYRAGLSKSASLEEVYNTSFMETLYEIL